MCSSDLNIASSSTTMFVSPANKVDSKNNDVKTVLASENTDKGKSILEAPLKLDKKQIKNPRAKKGNSQKPEKAAFLSSLQHSWTYST